MPDVCLFFVLLFTIFIIVVAQKLVLQRSKNVRKVYGKPIAPSLYSILFASDDANRSTVCTKESSRTAVHKSVYFYVLR